MAHSLSENKGLFSEVMSSVMGGGQSQEAAGEQDIQFAAKAHDMIYGQNQKSSSAQDLGSAAALQAFKMFAGGDSKKGGGSTEQLAGLAMSEGMKLFMNNNAGGAGQSDILKTAVQWALKFFMTQKMGSSSSGFSTLMNLASNMGGGGNAPAQAAAGSSGDDSGAKGLFGKLMSVVGGNK